MTSTDQYSQQQCAFPLFRQKFFGAALWANSDMDLGGGHDQGPAGGLQRPNLRTLDLKALPRDDGPVSETQLRRQKYAFFEKQCSRIEDGLFLSGDCVARSWDTLQANGVTHVLNCVGFICKEYFKDRGLTYRTYYLHGEQLRGGIQQQQRRPGYLHGRVRSVGGDSRPLTGPVICMGSSTPLTDHPGTLYLYQSMHAVCDVKADNQRIPCSL